MTNLDRLGAVGQALELQSLASREPSVAASEAFAVIERAAIIYNPILYGLGVRHGNGEVVMTIPGFGSSDLDHSELRFFLRMSGYRAIPSGIARNIGPIGRKFETVIRNLERSKAETGQSAIAAGHSLGGDIALFLAALRPDLVKGVFTFGSPFKPEHAHPEVRNLAEESIPKDRDYNALVDHIGRDKPLPDDTDFFCIKAKTDRVIREACHPNATACISVDSGTHSGLIWNPKVYVALSETIPLVVNKDHSQWRPPKAA